jgi:hypothetical protein
MNGGRHGNFFAAGGVKLKECHLCGGVLHGNPVWCKINVGFAPLKICDSNTLPKVGIKYFLGKRKWTTQCSSGSIHFGGHFTVGLLNEVKIEYHVIEFFLFYDDHPKSGMGVKALQN